MLSLIHKPKKKILNTNLCFMFDNSYVCKKIIADTINSIYGKKFNICSFNLVKNIKRVAVILPSHLVEKDSKKLSDFLFFVDCSFFALNKSLYKEVLVLKNKAYIKEGSKFISLEKIL